MKPGTAGISTKGNTLQHLGRCDSCLTCTLSSCDHFACGRACRGGITKTGLPNSPSAGDRTMTVCVETKSPFLPRTRRVGDVV